MMHSGLDRYGNWRIKDVNQTIGLVKPGAYFTVLYSEYDQKHELIILLALIMDTRSIGLRIDHKVGHPAYFR